VLNLLVIYDALAGPMFREPPPGWPAAGGRSTGQAIGGAVPVVPDTEMLATRAAAGDREALDQLLRLIGPEILRRCGRFLPNREDAEEAAQDALFQVARQIHTFEGRSRFSTWLYTVVANAARLIYRDL
jgi:RNA polymerase sigma-70 factor (ECF subfamily)